MPQPLGAEALLADDQGARLAGAQEVARRLDHLLLLGELRRGVPALREAESLEDGALRAAVASLLPGARARGVQRGGGGRRGIDQQVLRLLEANSAQGTGAPRAHRRGFPVGQFVGAEVDAAAVRFPPPTLPARTGRGRGRGGGRGRGRCLGYVEAMEIALQAQIGGGRALAAPLGLPGCVGLLLLAIGVHQEVARVIVEEDPGQGYLAAAAGGA